MDTIDGNAGMIAWFIRSLKHRDPRPELSRMLSRIASERNESFRTDDYWELLDMLRETEKCYQSGPSESLIEIAFHMLVSRCATAGFPPQASAPHNDSPGHADCRQLETEIVQAIASRGALDFILFRDGDVLARIPSESGARHAITAHPGFFELSVDTGWRLWSGTLGEADLILGASESKTLRAAAQTDETRPQPTLRVKLPSASIVLLVYAGFESGVILIDRLFGDKQDRGR